MCADRRGSVEHMHDDQIDAVLSPLRRPEPRRLQVQSAVRELIVRRIYQPGEHIGEKELAARLKVTRQPVREALQALHTEGWIELRVGRGAFVHVPTHREVQEVFRVRGALEAEGVRAAAPQVTADDITALREILAEGRAAVAAGDADAVVDANARFHRRLTDLAGNRFLSELLASLDQRVRWYFTPVARLRGSHSWDEHQAIVEAIERDEQDLAARLMREHSWNTASVYDEQEGDG